MLFNLPQYHLSTYKFKCNIAYMHTLSACSNLWSSHNLNCKLLTADHYLYKKLWVDSASAQVNKSIKVLKCC